MGGAVTRNRLRRRLRQLLAEEATAGLPSGWYLIGAAPGAGELASATVAASVRSVLTQVRS